MNLLFIKRQTHVYNQVFFFLQDGDIQEFQATLRMPPAVYNNLLNLLRPGLQKKHTNFRAPISPLQRLSITMRYIALGESFRSISQQFRVGLSTVREIVKHTCQCIISTMMQDYMKTPDSTEDWLSIADDFETKWNFPHCIGAIDGKHVRIVAPRNSGSLYYNYKEFFSIILLAVVNADYEFIFVSVGAEGKASDGGVFNMSGLKQHMEDPQNPLNIPPPSHVHGIPGRLPYYLVSDDAFKLDRYMQKPFPGYALTRKQKIFNYRLSRARRIVENTFGILSCRFRLLRRSIEVHPDTGQEIVMACCLLHNYLRKNARSTYLPPDAVDTEGDDGFIIDGFWRQEAGLTPLQSFVQRKPSDYAKDVRSRLADYFVSKAGQVEWQYERANIS